MKRIILIGIALGGLAAIGQTTVKADQGRPGNQGPWPVIISGTVPGAGSVVTGPDGGAVVVQERLCSGTSPHKITVTGVAAVATPSTQFASRTYIELCNSIQNTGTPLVKCRADGTAPVMAPGNIGDVLGIGDCKQYFVPASVVISCISDAAGTNVTSYECG